VYQTDGFNNKTCLKLDIICAWSLLHATDTNDVGQTDSTNCKHCIMTITCTVMWVNVSNRGNKQQCTVDGTFSYKRFAQESTAWTTTAQ